MPWQFYLLVALALLIIMAFKITKVLAFIIILSVLIIFIVAYFSKKGGRGVKT